ncbi:MAG TPA: division/cell wall cluster transcriptional repressor MraZ, partial [Candidatus Polarisedimenticolaceae bacterium]|nr:division/cell wall cluster transcriptional repressor MraZ [Candidatus Polarisedimenticolaceae bacterium]
ASVRRNCRTKHRKVQNNRTNLLTPDTREVISGAAVGESGIISHKSFLAYFHMFRGSFEHTLDGKGRLSIPAKFRDILLGKGDERIIMTNFVVDGLRCLDVYPIDEWLRLEEQISQRPKFERRMVLFQNFYLGGACECLLDKQGRILIPTSLRKYADLKRDVVLVSALEKFRVWDLETWKQFFADAEGKLMQDPDFLGDLGL